MESFFGIFAVACGAYCLYGYYMIRVKKEITKSILLPKDVNVNKCKDLEGYCRETRTPLLILGIVVMLYGAVDIYNTTKGGADLLFFIMMGVLFVTLAGFMVIVRRCNKKYF